MPFTRMMDGNEAAAWGALLSRAEVIPAYPITPQTEVISHIATFIAEGKMRAQYIKVEGEHTAMAAAVGASIAGARVFTASASQGIAFMEEALWMPAGRRLPIVMCMVNRSLAPLGGLRPDHNDALLQRDNGWIQLYCEDSQEVLDTIIMAYKIGEDKRVYLPVAPCYDGYFVSATATPTTVPDQSDVDDFLPSYEHETYNLMPEDYEPIPFYRPIAESRFEVQQAHERAKGIEGFKYIHTVIPCPTGWRFDPAKSVEVVRLGVQAWAWPLYEIENGVLKLTLKPKRRPIEDYLKVQNTFRHLTDDQIQYMQNEIDTKRQRLLENDGKRVIL